MVGSCEHHNEFSGFVNDWKCFDELSDDQLPMLLRAIRYKPKLHFVRSCAILNLNPLRVFCNRNCAVNRLFILGNHISYTNCIGIAG